MRKKKAIKIIKKQLKKLLEEGCHINDSDCLNTIRQKDMHFGKIVALEEMINVFKNSK